MKVVVMAGGEGSRLRPLTIGRPKPMVPIVNKPVMQHILELLKRHGYSDVVMTLQYMADYIQDYFGSGQSFGVKIQYAVEEAPLGTAGSVRNAASYLEPQGPLLIISGDAMTDFDLPRIVQWHRQRKALATMVLYRVPNPLEFGVITTDERGRVTRFYEKPSWGEVISDTVNTGIYVLDSSVLEMVEPGHSVDWSKDIFPLMLEKDLPLYGYVAEGYWCDIGNLNEYRRAAADVLSGKVRVGSLGHYRGGDVWTGDNVEIAPDAQLIGPIYLGNEVKVNSGAVIHGPTSIRDYTVVDNRAQIDRSLIWRNCYIGESSELRGAIVCRQSTMKARSVLYEGSVIGDGCVIGQGAVIHSNVKLWPGKEVEAGATVKSSIIWGSQGRRVLFGRFGVTGVVNVDLTPDFCARLGSAFGATLPKGSYVTINRDPHRSPRMLKRAIISGLPSSGVNVWDLGNAPVPVARYFTRVTQAVGGVHVRLSPHDQRVVDIRFMDADGLNLSKERERTIERIYFREDFRRAYMDDIGSIEYPNLVVERYTNGFMQALDVEAIRAARFKVVVDYAHSPNSDVLSPLLNRLNVDVVPLNARVDAHRIAVKQEDFEAGLRQLAIIASALNTNLGIQLDVAGEKIFLVDNHGQILSDASVAMLMATLALRSKGGGVIVAPIDVSHAFERLAEQVGGRVVRTRVDIHALMIAAQEPGVILATDGAGNFIFPAFQPVTDGLMATAKLLEFLATQQEPLSDLVRDLPEIFMENMRVACPWEIKGSVMRRLMEIHHTGETQEGIKLNFDTREWVLIRPDPDNPHIIITAESTSLEKLTSLLERFGHEVQRLRDLTE